MTISEFALRGYAFDMQNSLRPCLVVVFVLMAASAEADEVKLLESGGASTHGTATVTFQTTDNEHIEVRKILGQVQATTTSNFGNNTTMTGDWSQTLCTTPCKLELPAGHYKIRFGEYNPFNMNKPIDFDFRPGNSTYRVGSFNGGRAMSGFLLTLVGGTALIVGGSLAIVKSGTGYIALAGAGAGVTVGGIVLMATSHAEAVPVHDPSM